MNPNVKTASPFFESIRFVETTAAYQIYLKLEIRSGWDWEKAFCNLVWSLSTSSLLFKDVHMKVYKAVYEYYVGNGPLRMWGAWHFDSTSPPYLATGYSFTAEYFQFFIFKWMATGSIQGHHAIHSTGPQSPHTLTLLPTTHDEPLTSIDVM
jgi:hypothetical protein